MPENYTCAPPDGLIRVSLVVPMRNEEGSLQTLIDSICQQTCPPAEVLLVDGGSTDKTVVVARSLSAGDTRFRVLEAGEATPGRGRNVGVTAAHHAWIALTDAGIRLESTWLGHLVEVVKRDVSVAVVYGNYEPLTHSFFERCAALAYPPPKQYRPGGWMRGPSVASSLIHRDVWEAIGGFPDLRAAEDLIFMERIQEQGFKVGWAPTATVWWHIQPTLRATFQKFVLYSRHNVLAGRQRYWHYGVAQHYLVGIPFVALGLVHSLWWLVIPLLGALTRAAKSIWVRREGRRLRWLLNPVQFMGVGVTLATIDLATFVGWGQALWQRRAQVHPASAAGYPPHRR